MKFCDILPASVLEAIRLHRDACYYLEDARIADIQKNTSQTHAAYGKAQNAENKALARLRVELFNHAILMR